MNAILVNASPRKNGNTAALLDRVREGIEEGGCETKTVHLGGFDKIREADYADYEQRARELGRRLAAAE